MPAVVPVMRVGDSAEKAVDGSQIKNIDVCCGEAGSIDFAPFDSGMRTGMGLVETFTRALSRKLGED
jgi:hypothetical protein